MPLHASCFILWLFPLGYPELKSELNHEPKELHLSGSSKDVKLKLNLKAEYLVFSNYPPAGLAIFVR